MEKTKCSIKSLIVALEIAYIFCNKAVPWVTSNIKDRSRTT